MSSKQFVKHCREQFVCGGSIKKEINKYTNDIEVFNFNVKVNIKIMLIYC